MMGELARNGNNLDALTQTKQAKLETSLVHKV